MKRVGGITVRGDWPGAVTLRSGWAKAAARPWNDQDPTATLRFERGSADFLRACAEALIEIGAPAVLSVPVHRTGRGVWTRAGFVPDRELMLMETRLSRQIPEPDIEVRPAEVDEVAAIDDAAFDPDWRIGRLGLADALRATTISTLIATGDPPVGFAIVGVSGSTGYLQRIAVHPDQQGSGIGRKLVRAAMRWAKGSGARTMLLNTQLDNDRAALMYRAEGFEKLADRLTVFRASPDGDGTP